MRHLAGVFNTIDMIHTDLCRHIFAQPHSSGVSLVKPLY